MTSAMETDRTMSTVESQHRIWDAFVHSSSLILAIAVAVGVGSPYGWIALLFPLGPLFAAALMRAVGAGTPRAMRSLLAFTIGSSILVGGGWTTIWLGDIIEPLAFVFPLALLAFIVGLLNYVMIVVSRTLRALKGQTFDYPWIPDRLARLVGLPDRWME
ncbi:MAG: hypothetical protein AB8G14_18910 [Ilumatobacter sp.]